ncbi:MAG: hypothetical protein C0598_10470 [Marinilabiliales bacterium]|nr:MAG: hypothetical protein C0598_10470 [Marinilabiliales bacterium]
MGNRLKYLLLNPIIISFIMSLIVIWFIPDAFEKYEIVKKKIGKSEEYQRVHIYSCDLNSDGNDEYLFSFEYNGKHSIQVITPDLGIVDQWNLRGKIPSGERFCIGDYDNDGYKEIYAFSENNDTLFLYSFEPYDTNGLIIKDTPILELSHKYAKPEYFINHMELINLDKDTVPELFFIVNSGRSKFPRNLYIYDLQNQELDKSRDIGMTLSSNIQFKDLDGDKLPEIFGDVIAAGQVHDSLGYDYSDYSSWLLVYKNNLELLFEPIEFKHFRTQLCVDILETNEQNMIAALSNHMGQYDNYPKLLLVNQKGEIVKQYIFPKSPKNNIFLNIDSSKNNKKIVVMYQSGLVKFFNEDLVLTDSLKLENSILAYQEFDIDNDGKNERIFRENTTDFVISRNNFTFPLKFSVDGSVTLFSLNRNNGNVSLCISTSEGGYLVEYKLNRLYYFKYLVNLAVFIALYLFIRVIRKLQLIQLEKKEKIRKQIVDLQLKNFNNQMDPHFTFNVFNAIAYKIQNESPESYEAFMEFSKLIRKSLVAHESITQPIFEEINKLESYLKLEKLRYGEKLSYNININDDVDQSKHIPKMILQTYVENAIKHGIKHKHENGKVDISINNNQHSLQIEISDDGIGRKKSKELKTQGTGIGLKLMDNYFKLFNEFNKNKITYNITDLYDNKGNPSGTNIKVLIPRGFKYPLSTSL